MNLRDLLALSMKTAGLVLIVLLVADLPEYLKGYLALEKMTGETGLWIYALPLLLPLLLAVLFITFPYSLSDRLICSKEDLSELNLERFEIMAMRLLGLVLLYLGVSDLAFHLSNFMLMRSDIGQEFGASAYNYPYLLATLVELVFALLLLMRARGIQALLHRLER